LLHILATYPDPIFPQEKIFFPIFFSTDSTCWNISFSYSSPTINVNVPALDPVTPPETGASIKVKPSFFAFSPKSIAF
jgi:hypothetical protein